MIYTVTLNPSLDYVLEVKDFRMGTVNRSEREVVMPGGKGINVSLMLRELGFESTAMGFLAGFTGREIVRSLRNMGISEDFLFVCNGISRINVKLKGGEETEINAAGPEIAANEVAALLKQIENTVKNGDILVLSGSVPGSVASLVYTDIVRRISGKDVRIVADVTGRALKDLLSLRPFLIKPNHHELGELFGCKITSREEAGLYAQRLYAMGAENVLVSLAGDGAVLVTKEGVYFADAPEGKVLNSVGAGDSSVAGFLAGWLIDGDSVQALRLAVAAGSATAFSEGIAKAETVFSLRNRVRIAQGVWKCD